MGLFTYTTDGRFTALHSESSDDWTLRIASAQVSDSGSYECQVSTEPKISKAFELQVVGKLVYLLFVIVCLFWLSKTRVSTVFKFMLLIFDNNKLFGSLRT